MKIGIDISQTAFPGSGVARYTTSLISALVEYDQDNEYVFFYSSLRVPLDKNIKELIRAPHVLKEFRFPPSLLSFMWNTMRILPIEYFIGKVDIFMSSDWTQPPTKRAIKITTIHDMVIYVNPETTTTKTKMNVESLTVSPNIYSQQKTRHKIIKKESIQVFVDSLFTKTETEKYLGLKSESLHLLYPAVENNTHTSTWDVIKNKFKIATPYILTVGKREPRKNIDALIEAYRISGIDDAQLIIVGDQGWGENSTENVKGVKFLGFVSDDDLAALYQHAEFFVFPSIYEGFGYPVIEAMGYGCPVATSDTSSLAEIADNSALMFNPHDVQGIKKTLNELHNSKEHRDDLIKKGNERYKSFSRRIFAENFVKIVQAIHHDNRS